MGWNLFGLIVRDGVVVLATDLRRHVSGLFVGMLEMRCGRVGCSGCSVYCRHIDDMQDWKRVIYIVQGPEKILVR